MDNVIAIAVILVILGLASFYLYKQKKKGNACVGCPMASKCTSQKCTCGCNTARITKEPSETENTEK